MAEYRQPQGPGKGVLGIGQRIITIIVEMVETRVRLAVVELEEEKANLVQILLMLGMTMLFAAFAIPSERDDRDHRRLTGSGAYRRIDDVA